MKELADQYFGIKWNRDYDQDSSGGSLEQGISAQELERKTLKSLTWKKVGCSRQKIVNKSLAMQEDMVKRMAGKSVALGIQGGTVWVYRYQDTRLKS